MAKLSARFCLIVCILPLACSAGPGNDKDPRRTATDSVVRPASMKYFRMNLMKRIFLGRNYRKEWETPVKMPLFDVRTVKGGLTPDELGGGQQTKSLRLKDKEGKEWVLRTVDKDVTDAAVQPIFRKTFVKKMVQDMVSASHPYAALSVKELAKAADVVAPEPVLYFVPEDKNLGPHYQLFANKVCMLEEREPTPDGSETENSEKVLEELTDKNDVIIMQEQVLRARLLDMLVADWDRHIDQWRWGKKDSAGQTYFYVIPRDRDFAFFNSHGLLTKAMSMTMLPHLGRFTDESKNLKKLNHKTWFFDQNFLNGLDAEAWKRIISDFQNRMSDNVINKAIRQIPPEVYAVSGPMLEARLKSRRDGLMRNGLKYYEYLASSVHVMGTNKRDLFKVSAKGDGMVISMYAYDGKHAGLMTYQRVFKKGETYQVHLEGFGDDDHFVVEDDVDSKIHLYINGGDGKDSYTNRGKRVREKLNGVEHEDVPEVLSKKD
jgi:hypothetical protein